MIHLTLAISDFLLILISAGAWAGAGLAGEVLLALAALAGIALLVRRFLRAGR